MDYVDALSRAPLHSIENAEGKAEVTLVASENSTMCILLTQEERVRMCQTADEDIIQLIKLT